MSVVIDDPAFRTPARLPGTTPRVYFGVGNGDAHYTLVATDRAHAERMLSGAGVDWFDENGAEVHFANADLSWEEISHARAAEIRVYEDDGRTGPFPLNTFEPGDWFCSEF